MDSLAEYVDGLPNLCGLVCTDSHGNTASIIAVVKTQGSNTKLVGQMQPYYEAKGPLTAGAVSSAGLRTSCYRYWGQGIWTGYGAELARRASQAADMAT